MTHNPDKINTVRAARIEIVERLSADVPDNAHSAHYLATKREKLGHLCHRLAISIHLGLHFPVTNE